jgi:hypothetical protein
MLESGEYATIREIAAAEKINETYVGHLLRLSLLAPDIVEAILNGRQPARLQLDGLRRRFPVEWREQRAMLLTESSASRHPGHEVASTVRSIAPHCDRRSRANLMHFPRRRVWRCCGMRSQPTSSVLLIAGPRRNWAGSMSYGADNVAMYRQTATYVAKILRGAKPADLPVEQPTKFELAVNLKTAKASSVELPTAILLRADEVIE